MNLAAWVNGGCMHYLSAAKTTSKITSARERANEICIRFCLFLFLWMGNVETAIWIQPRVTDEKRYSEGVRNSNRGVAGLLSMTGRDAPCSQLSHLHSSCCIVGTLNDRQDGPAGWSPLLSFSLSLSLSLISPFSLGLYPLSLPALLIKRRGNA